MMRSPQTKNYMKTRLTLLALFLGGITLLATAIIPYDNSTPPALSLPVAYNQAITALGFQTNQFHCINVATNGMTERHPFESQPRSSFLESEASAQRQVLPLPVFIRTFQDTGHPHPVLSRSTTSKDFWIFHPPLPAEPS